MPKRKKPKGHRSPWVKKNKNSACDRPLRKGIKRPAQKGVQQDWVITAGITSQRGRQQRKPKVGQRNIKPIIMRGPASDWSERPKESPHERPGNADGESPGYGRHMSSRQTLGQIWKGSTRKAQASPACTQPI